MAKRFSSGGGLTIVGESTNASGLKAGDVLAHGSEAPRLRGRHDSVRWNLLQPNCPNCWAGAAYKAALRTSEASRDADEAFRQAAEYDDAAQRAWEDVRRTSERLLTARVFNTSRQGVLPDPETWSRTYEQAPANEQRRSMLQNVALPEPAPISQKLQRRHEARVSRALPSVGQPATRVESDRAVAVGGVPGGVDIAPDVQGATRRQAMSPTIHSFLEVSSGTRFLSSSPVTEQGQRRLSGLRPERLGGLRPLAPFELWRRRTHAHIQANFL
eukprot:TRINITY_DN11923_c0_g1_i2.p1 TRINITY_DN11923_c0_g1~~TRINITY_DN11923_c0_g1_i2.p1  ORF type:complete len:272 (+),score=30.02 TRINITY_DN11923_c0_g1_i2:120-935(+)